MKLIVGLGNPGAEYETNRHNIGFLVLDQLAEQMGESWKAGYKSLFLKGRIGNEDVLIQKPVTFMNLSGEAVQALASYFKITPENICVIHDDLDLAPQTVRLKVGGGDGGHNGLKSITKCLATNAYARVRMGIGRPLHPGMDPADYVLGNFSDHEWKQMEDYISRGIDGSKAFVNGNFQTLMNTFNQREKN